MALEVLGGDRLSDLPDAILISVLRLLRLDEAARCSVLASRWRGLFPSTFLLGFNTHMPGRRDVVKAVNSILAAHPTAPIRSFRTSEHFQDSWIEELARRGVQELCLNFDWVWWSQSHGPRRRIPASVFACTTLTRLRAGRCVFPDASVTATGAPHLVNLTEVELSGVTICDGSLNVLLSQCKSLELLQMSRVGDLGHVRVRSPSLRVLNCDSNMGDLVIEYAPSLELLYGRYMYQKSWQQKGVHLMVEHAPKLEFLGYISMKMSAIEIGESVLTEDGTAVKTLLPSLKTLAIKVCYKRKGYINWITQILRMFPCLEALYIRSDSWSVFQAAAQESWDVWTCIPCVDNHLQKVVFEVYRGHEWQRDMAKFLHGRSMFLKAMEFHCMWQIPNDHPGEEWVRQQQDLLCLDSRASKDARFLFFKGQMACDHFDVANKEGYKRQYHGDLYDV